MAARLQQANQELSARLQQLEQQATAIPAPQDIAQAMDMDAPEQVIPDAAVLSKERDQCHGLAAAPSSTGTDDVVHVVAVQEHLTSLPGFS